MSSIATGDSGFPLGGSIQMAQNMVDTFLSLGGKITYSTKVEKIITEKFADKKNEKQKVVAVKTDKGIIDCDSVIVTQDTRNAIDNLFEEKLIGLQKCEKMLQVLKIFLLHLELRQIYLTILTQWFFL